MGSLHFAESQMKLQSLFSAGIRWHERSEPLQVYYNLTWKKLYTRQKWLVLAIFQAKFQTHALFPLFFATRSRRILMQTREASL